MDLDASQNRRTGTEAVTTFTSRDIDFATERLTSISGASSSVECQGNPDAFSMSFAAAKLGDLILSKTRVTNWSLTRARGNLTNISIPITGTPPKIRYGTRSYEVSASDKAAVGRPFGKVLAKLAEGSAMVLHAPLRP
jgi:hypothetical protein